MSIESAIKNFERNGFKTRHFTTPEDLRKYLADNIVDTTVGMGGSVTLTELKICDALKGRNKIYWHAIDKSAKTFEEASLAEVYILSANALSESGEIVNIDGRGNRISGALFGANRKKVVYVCGTNKLEADLEKALWRAKNIAAPKNAQRLGIKTPCALKGDKCYNCNSPQTICRSISITRHPTSAETELLLLDGDWGY